MESTQTVNKQRSRDPSNFNKYDEIHEKHTLIGKCVFCRLAANITDAILY